jgi:c-di-GMP-binding flagellar brake protein YcgR
LQLFAAKSNKMGAMDMSLMEKTLDSERRKYPRSNVDLPVKYCRTNFFLKQGQAINASEGGLLVCLPEKMDIGQHLALKLFFPSLSELNIIETIIQVAWMGIHLRKDWTWDYRTGVRFEDISPENMTVLKNFLMSLAQKPLYTS